MPGLPKNLVSTYQKYKNHTDSIAHWLASTARNRGYVSPKAKKSGKSGKALVGGPTYTVAIKEWTAMAEFIAGLTLLDATIALRHSFSNNVSEILEETQDKKESDAGHAYFLSVLKNVRGILSSRLPKRPKAQSSPQTFEELMNIFEHLELEEPSEAFEQAPDMTPTKAPIFRAEHPVDMEEAYFVFYLLLRDFANLRTEVLRAWSGYNQGGHDIIAASITTNIAVDLARSMTEELRKLSEKHSGIMKMYQVFCASQFISESTAKRMCKKDIENILNFRERPGDEMNFTLYKVADNVLWPAYTLLNGWCSMHKANPHPEMKRGFYGTYDPASDRKRKTNRDKFLEDKILLLENLPEFYFYHCNTKPNTSPVEDEFIRGLRTMFETKTVTLPVVFATTLFLDIHHILRDGVDYGFKRLTDATHFVVGDIKEELKFHTDIAMETWPVQNDQTMQRFVDTIEFWVHEDHQRENAPKMGRKFIPEPFHLFRKHPWWCGLWKYWTLMQFHEFSIAFVNAWGAVMSCAHLYNAVGGRSRTDMRWKDLEVVIGLHDPKTFFIGEAPTTSDECLKRFALAMGASAANLARSTRTKKGLTLSKKGPKGLKELGAVLQTFRARICGANGPKDIRAEDVQKILDNSTWDYELDAEDNAEQVYKDIGGDTKAAPKKQLPVNKCVGLVRDLLHAETVEVSFDYFRMHRQCWRLLRVVKNHCRADLIRIYGPEYLDKESQLPFVVGYVLMTATSTQQIGDMPKARLPGVQVTSQVLEGAKHVIEGMLESGAGALVVDQILPRALDLHIEFEAEQ
ncbi:hypothetical protein DM02DRAFT_698351 [Periconia macrospinosa]|uniref:DUF6604 domain-containing protein n=1 Tax=Periconia macrospinosa TaxID=97972 RepID=A0A2V1D440_9PLEO|nr:hypothetical protein DM02DRAFT_698351 [Periconia macrospinosa]